MLSIWRLWLAVMVVMQPARAHEFAPSLFKVIELGDDHYNVVWKSPVTRSKGAAPPTPQWPAICKEVSSIPAHLEGAGVVRSWHLQCGGRDAEGLVGQTLSVSGLGADEASALVVVERLDGPSVQQLLTAKQSSWKVPARTRGGAVARNYTVLGVEHIWGGMDHLLFVFGLLLLVGGGTRLFWTTTAFTVGHSVTLGLVALGYYDHPVALVELAIALSIFALAVELARNSRGHLLWRKPWWLASGFGLLHGMGFAGALADTGLPQDHVPLALLSFNVGIELGQIVFVCTALLAWALVRKPLAPWVGRLRMVPIYALGVSSGMWCIERAVVLFR